jgi:uncharacterized RDD family membrane protein YckC
MQSHGKKHFFDPHDTARADSLAGVPLASFRRRLAAYVIDCLLIGLTYIPAMMALEYTFQTKMHGNEELYHSGNVAVRFNLEETKHVAWAVWLVLYFGLIGWATNGLTLGKRLMGIRVVSLTHTRISLWQSIERALGYGASALEAGTGFLQYFTARNHCCVHDRIAETIVVNDRAIRKASQDSATGIHAAF